MSKMKISPRAYEGNSESSSCLNASILEFGFSDEDGMNTDPIFTRSTAPATPRLGSARRRRPLGSGGPSVVHRIDSDLFCMHWIAVTLSWWDQTEVSYIRCQVTTRLSSKQLNNGNAATEKKRAHHIMKIDICIIACRKLVRIKINTCHAMYDTHNAKVFK